MGTCKGCGAKTKDEYCKKCTDWLNQKIEILKKRDKTIKLGGTRNE